MNSLFLPVYKLSQENTLPENMRDIIFEKTKGRGGKVNRTSVMEKQPFEGFFKKGLMRNFEKFTRKHLRWILFFDNVKLCRSATSLTSL